MLCIADPLQDGRRIAPTFSMKMLCSVGATISNLFTVNRPAIATRIACGSAPASSRISEYDP
jgi:hypothetical protein